jgi:hypothetical protein
MLKYALLESRSNSTLLGMRLLAAMAMATSTTTTMTMLRASVTIRVWASKACQSILKAAQKWSLLHPQAQKSLPPPTRQCPALPPLATLIMITITTQR